MNALSRLFLVSLLLGLLVPIGLARADGLMPCTHEAMQANVSPFAIDGRTAAFMEQAEADLAAGHYDDAIRRLTSARNRADGEAGASCVVAEVSARLVRAYLGRADALDAQISQVGAAGDPKTTARIEALRGDARQALRDAREAQADYARRTGGQQLRSVSWALNDVGAGPHPSMLAGAGPAEAETSSLQIVGWTSIGLGVASAVAGGLLYRETKHIDQLIVDLALREGSRYDRMLAARSQTLRASHITLGVGSALLAGGLLAVVFGGDEPEREAGVDMARVHFGLDRVALEVTW